MLIERGYGWRALFLFAAIVAGVMLFGELPVAAGVTHRSRPSGSDSPIR